MPERMNKASSEPEPLRIARGLLMVADRGVRALTIGALWGAAALTVALAMLGAVEVAATQFLGRAVPSAFEYQEVMMGLTVFGALAAVQYHQSHIAVDIFTGGLTGRAKMLSDVLALVAGTAVFTLFTWQSARLALRSVAVRELSPGYVAFPLYMVKACVFLCCLIGLLEFVRQLVRLLAGAPHRIDQTDFKNEG